MNINLSTKMPIPFSLFLSKFFFLPFLYPMFTKLIREHPPCQLGINAGARSQAKPHAKFRCQPNQRFETVKEKKKSEFAVSSSLPSQPSALIIHHHLTFVEPLNEWSMDVGGARP